MSGFEVNEVVQALQRTRIAWRDSQGRAREPTGREFPSRNALAGVVECLKGVLFPLRLGPSDLRHESEDFYVARTLDSALHTLLDQALLESRYTARRTSTASGDTERTTRALLRDFAAGLPAIRRLLDSDAVAAYEGDPAAHSVDEVLLCYPGLLAMIHYRLAHSLYTLGLPLLARIISELAHGQTGIDIHPGATIGPRFFIDHGTGVVIGETAVIGQGVRLYQNVTLGAKRFPTEADGTTLKKGLPRHPTVEDDVVVYAGATILGRVTIGRGAVIGGNVWPTDSVPAGASVTQAMLQNAPHAAGTAAARG
ncbi:serine O-acetyltransferase EpsC [Xylophilus ampelinus]|uniref:serine O-acetyltransferase n=1 Tax=Xylophilus ampelinus TaxID=54067 RepID=A0A318SIK8_9BURK|nr:serine O-acetyltransferase EpsC [Xylophilus ampelinus]MCS4509805.1 serine acetyltransferase [Xylophilus ampelinus]PYE78665.1 serine O-acetyltransferase [Xylophilus ampelinus]